MATTTTTTPTTPTPTTPTTPTTHTHENPSEMSGEDSEFNDIIAINFSLNSNNTHTTTTGDTCEIPNDDFTIDGLVSDVTSDVSCENVEMEEKSIEEEMEETTPPNFTRDVGKECKKRERRGKKKIYVLPDRKQIENESYDLMSDVTSDEIIEEESNDTSDDVSDDMNEDDTNDGITDEESDTSQKHTDTDQIHVILTHRLVPTNATQYRELNERMPKSVPPPPDNMMYEYWIKWKKRSYRELCWVSGGDPSLCVDTTGWWENVCVFFFLSSSSLPLFSCCY
jgi:hypothetical protein